MNEQEQETMRELQQALDELAQSLYFQGRAEEGHQHHLRAVDLSLAAGGAFEAGYCELFFAMNWLESEVSLPYYQHAIELFTSIDEAYGEATAQFNSAETLAALGRYEESLPHFQHAIELFTSIDEAYDEAGVQWSLADALARLGRYEESLPHFERALALSETAEVPAPNALALVVKGLAGALTCLGRGEEALPHFERAASMLAAAGDGVREASCRLDVAGIRCGTAQVSRSDEDKAAFVTAAEAFLDAYERARAALRFLMERQHFQGEWTGALALLASGAASLDLPELLWRIEQTIKARTFQEETQESDLWRRLLDTHPDLHQAQQALEQLRMEYERLGADTFYDSVRYRAISGREGDHARRAERQQELASAEQRVRGLLANIAAASPDVVGMDSVAPPTLLDLREALAPDEAYYGFLWLDSMLLRMLVTKGGGLRMDQLAREESDSLAAWIDCARGDYRRCGDWETLNEYDRSRALLGSIPEGVRTLLISPHGPLTAIPFHQLAAPNVGAGGPSLLGDRYALAVVPAAGMIVQARSSEQVRHASSYLGVACNADDAIPGVDHEIRHVAERYFAGPPPGEAFLTEDR